jgi:hypothetical protein
MSDLYVDRLNFRDGTVMGTPIQTVLTRTSTLQSVTTTIPQDNTIPTSSEGTELTGLTTSFTPKKIGNIIIVTVNLFFGTSANVSAAAALFKNSDAAAIAAAGQISNITVSSMMFHHKETVTSLDAISFKVRMGPTSAATVYLNGVAGAQLFGGVASSSITIEEIQA